MRCAFVLLATTAVCLLAWRVSAAPSHSALLSNEPASENVLEDLFTSFMKQFKKNYCEVERSARFKQFKINAEIIRRHNSIANSSYTLGINQFADLSREEFNAKFLAAAPRRANAPRFSTRKQVAVNTAPASMDWRQHNAVTPVKDQNEMECGSGWAFAAAGAIESAWVLQGNHSLVSLSEQQLMDCSTAYGDTGCKGGLMQDAYEYAIGNGMCSESSYPYKAVQGTCQSCSKVALITGFIDIQTGNEPLMKNIVGTAGPVSTLIEADSNEFHLYESGVFDGPCGNQLNHGILIVGYGVAAPNGEQYWIVKNSWGSSWGEQGYMRMLRNDNKCAVSLFPSYPTL